jgi:hypothetical protein
MNKLQLTGVALAIGAASMFALAPAFADEAPAAEGKPVTCVGGNACKGQSACKTSTNACKGQNTCKGKGVVETKNKEDCDTAGGTVQPADGTAK